MTGESRRDSEAPLYQIGGEEDGGAAGRTVEVRLHFSGAEQFQQDRAVAAALQRRVVDRLPVGRGTIQVLFCDDPRLFGVPLEALAAIEEAAYHKARYGTRAERMGHFENVFRNYPEDKHGPLRYVIVTETEPEGRYTDVLVFGDYFEVDDYDLLGPAYAEGVAAWERDHPDLLPGRYVVSKLVSNPNRPVAIGFFGLGAFVLAAVLEGIASVPRRPDRLDGALVAAQAQPASQKMIGVALRRLMPDLTILRSRKIPIEDGAADAPAHMLAYVPPMNNDV